MPRKVIFLFFTMSFFGPAINAEVPSALKSPQKVELAEAQSATSKINEQADRLFKKMTDALKASKEFKFEAEVSDDLVLNSGQKIQVDATVRVKVKKPGAFYGYVGGGVPEKSIWYNGKTFTLLSHAENFYAVVDVPETIDAALNVMKDKYGVVAPLSDIAYADPYALLSPKVRASNYLGVVDIVGVACHHLAFRSEKVDWQLWIVDDEEAFLPRKLVITYKKVPHSPQYMAFFSMWDMQAEHDDREFEYEVDEDAVRIGFHGFSQKDSPSKTEEVAL